MRGQEPIARAGRGGGKYDSQIFKLLVRERIHNYKVFPSAVCCRLLAILITLGVIIVLVVEMRVVKNDRSSS